MEPGPTCFDEKISKNIFYKPHHDAPPKRKAISPNFKTSSGDISAHSNLDSLDSNSDHKSENVHVIDTQPSSSPDLSIGKFCDRQPYVP